jgi:hypothetical protein
MKNGSHHWVQIEGHAPGEEKGRAERRNTDERIGTEATDRLRCRCHLQSNREERIQRDSDDSNSELNMLMNGVMGKGTAKLAQPYCVHKLVAKLPIGICHDHLYLEAVVACIID